MKNPVLPYLRLVGIAFLCMAFGRVSAQEDPGKAEIGQVSVTVFFATDGDPKVAGERAEEVGPAIRTSLQKEAKLKFSHYRTMGADTKPVFRSYENWAQPLAPSDEILVRFETRSQAVEGSISLDFELWLARKKILKTDVLLREGRPLYILGPEWRGGRLIIAVALAQ
jgi:hypothetical protein